MKSQITAVFGILLLACATTAWAQDDAGRDDPAQDAPPNPAQGTPPPNPGQGDADSQKGDEQQGDDQQAEGDQQGAANPPEELVEQDNEPITKLEGDKWRFAYENTPWPLVINQFVADSKYSFYYESMPEGTLTYRNDKKTYNLSEYMDFLNSMMLFKNYTLVRHENMLILCQIDELPKQVLNPRTPDILEGDDAIGDYEWATVLFPLSRYPAEDAQGDIQAQLGPSEFVTSIPRARQVIVTAMGKKLRMVKDMIERVEGELEGFRIFQLNNISTAEVLPLVKNILGIAPDMNSSDDGETRISEDVFQNRIIAKANPGTLDLIDNLLKSLDPEDAGAAADIVEQPPLELKAYGTTGVDPAQVLAVVQSLLAGIPGVRASVDAVSGNLLVYARQPEHELVTDTLSKMTDQAQKMPHIFQLMPGADPAMAMNLVQGLFTAPGNTPTASAPTLQINSVNKQLIMMGTSAQVAVADEALKAMNWLRNTEAGVGSDGYIVINGARNRVDAFINMLRGEYGTSRINVVIPADLNRGNVREIPRQEDRPLPNFDNAFPQQNSTQPPNEGGASSAPRNLNRGRPDVPTRRESPVYERQQPAQPQGRIVSLVPLKGDQQQRMASNRSTRLPRGPMGAVAVDGGIILRGRQRDVDGLQDVGNDIFGKEIPAGNSNDNPRTPEPKDDECNTFADEDATYETALQDGEAPPDPQQAAPANDNANNAAPPQDDAADSVGSSQDGGDESQENQQPQGEPNLDITVLGNQVIIRSDDPQMLAYAEELWNLVGGGGATDANLPTVIYLKHTDCVDVADFLNKMLGGGAVPGGEDAGGGNMLGNLAGSLLGGGGAGDLIGGLMGGGPANYSTTSLVRIVPDTRSNALFVQGPPESIDWMVEVLSFIDVAQPPENNVAREPRMIPIYFHNAEEIAQNVRDIFADDLKTGGNGNGGSEDPREQFMRAIMQQQSRGRSRGGRSGGGGGSSQSDATKMTLSVDAANNSLLVAAPQELFDRVENFVRMLDSNAESNVDVVRVLPIDGVNPEWVIDILQNVMGDRLESNVALARPSTSSNGFGSRGSGTSRFGDSSSRGGGNFNFGNFGGSSRGSFGGGSGFTRGTTSGRSRSGDFSRFSRGSSNRGSSGFGRGGSTSGFGRGSFGRGGR